jgi:hypothetical protein
LNRTDRLHTTTHPLRVIPLQSSLLCRWCCFIPLSQIKTQIRHSPPSTIPRYSFMICSYSSPNASLPRPQTPFSFTSQKITFTASLHISLSLHARPLPLPLFSQKQDHHLSYCRQKQMSLFFSLREKRFFTMVVDQV